MTTLEIRGAHRDLLHRVLARGAVALRQAVDAADTSLPGFVWRELDAYQRCGDPAHGFAWLHCAEDDHHVLVPFSCKGRAFCPGCIGRRMAEMARRWCDTLLPHVPFRQWVITVPWSRRKQLAYQPTLARGVLALALDEIFAWLTEEARLLGLDDARCGAVTAQQRWGSALNLNLHFHALLPDGVFSCDPAGAVAFHRLPPPRRTDLEALVARIAARSEAWLEAQDADEPPDPDDAQAVLIAAAVEGKVAAGPRAGAATRRTQDGEQARDGELRRGVSCDGYGLHAGTAVPAHARDALERLARYFLRPPLAKGRLHELPDGQVRWTMRKAWSDGTTGFVFTPLELTQRLAAYVVPPRVHTVHYHGVFAPRSSWRADVVPDPDEVRRHRAAVESARNEVSLRKRVRRRRRRGWSSWCPWSELLERVFSVGGTRCSRCGKPMHLRAVVVGPPATLRVLAGLRKSARAPPSSPLFP